MIFALDTLNVRHISISALVDLLTLESVSLDAHLAVTVSTKFEVDFQKWFQLEHIGPVSYIRIFLCYFCFR